MNKLLVIVAGPTASGKTRMAIDLALHFDTVVVSADSRQFYKELTIGTAKPDETELNSVLHYFINSHSVTESYNAGDYAVEAKKLLDELFEKYQVVVMAGGSGLYIDAVINGMDDLPPASQEVRTMLDELFKNSGIAALQQQLLEKDPEGFKSIDKNNPRRIMRAIEVTLTSGKPYSSFLGNKSAVSEWEIVLTGIDLPRETLYERINQRVISMIESGLESEARSVYEFRERNALKTVGYKEMFEYIDGVKSLSETINSISQNTRNYAKRQMTWFRRYPDMIWVKPDQKDLIIDLVNKKLNN